MNYALMVFPFLIVCEQAIAESSEKQTDAFVDFPLDDRIQSEKTAADNYFVITPHKPIYLLPISYNDSPNNVPYIDNAIGSGTMDKLEIKFQISLKFSVVSKIFGNNGNLSLAYTQQSYWQAYNSAESSPFRETDHEPEAILSFDTDWEIFKINIRYIQIGLTHQSNGRRGELSRSWNRLYMNFLLESAHWVTSIKPWWRFSEKGSSDNNPDFVV